MRPRARRKRVERRNTCNPAIAAGVSIKGFEAAGGSSRTNGRKAAPDKAEREEVKGLGTRKEHPRNMLGTCQEHAKRSCVALGALSCVCFRTLTLVAWAARLGGVSWQLRTCYGRTRTTHHDGDFGGPVCGNALECRSACGQPGHRECSRSAGGAVPGLLVSTLCLRPASGL